MWLTIQDNFRSYATGWLGGKVVLRIEQQLLAGKTKSLDIIEKKFFEDLILATRQVLRV